MNTFPFLLPIVSCAALVAVLTGCATSAPSVKTRPDPTVAYADYRTFAVLRSAGGPMSAGAVVSPQLIRRIRSETESLFAAKGLTQARAEDADLHVVVRGGVHNRIDVDTLGAGYGPMGRVRGYDVSQYDEGSLIIDVIDARAREVIWRGSVEADIDGEPDLDKTLAAVTAIVMRYPN